MFECSKCTTHALRAILRDVSQHLGSASRPLVLTPQYQPRQQRRTAVAIRREQRLKDDAAVPFDEATKELGISPVPKRHLEIEMRWLNDKVKLANHVRDLLFKKDEFDKALALVQLASKSRDEQGGCIVAWNHLLKYQLEKGSKEKAWQLFNDMKKRAQVPDSHTYVAMFKGLSSIPDKHKKLEAKHVQRIVNIYNAMYAPNCKTKPTVIHANAALQACSLTTDMDALWSILSRLEEEGPNSADAITYTVVLNAIRLSALGNTDAKNASIDQIRKLKIEAVEQGRSLWVDIVKKWRSGRIQMDGRLITAMAQLLLFSPRLRDWDNVLDLIQQTMDIDRLVEPVGSPGRKVGHVPQQHDAFDDIEALSSKSLPPTAIANAFQPLQETAEPAKKKGGKLDTFKYARPDAGILSVIQQACFIMRTPRASAEYWNLLTTKPYSVRPDLSNVEIFIRMCSVNRSSSSAATLLEEMFPKYGVKPRNITLSCAMDACQRNVKNPSSLEHAGKIIDVMSKHLEYPDVAILIQYLQLALYSDKGDKIVHALKQMEEPVKKLQTLAADGITQSSTFLENATSLHQGMIGAIDTLMKEKLVPAESFGAWNARRSDINRFITKLKGLSSSQTSDKRAEIRKSDAQGKPAEFTISYGGGRPGAADSQYKRSRSDTAKPIHSGHAASKSKRDTRHRNTRSASRQQTFYDDPTTQLPGDLLAL